MFHSANQEASVQRQRRVLSALLQARERRSVRDMPRSERRSRLQWTRLLPAYVNIRWFPYESFMWSCQDTWESFSISHDVTYDATDAKYLALFRLTMEKISNETRKRMCSRLRLDSLFHCTIHSKVIFNGSNSESCHFFYLNLI